ncbi:MAG TPA: nucleotidyl transferase AbiEii/AbiGii toxin family protein [bacterium]|nr:nucleotidyl transferase AbiEii/AbiGii toxin family protein [bacterium]
MDAFIHRTRDERRRIFEQVESQRRLPAHSVEKDIWLSLAVRELFSLPDIGPHLTFKGGTALSKVWKIIERFSEDVDLTIDRAVLGFDGAMAPETAPSMKKRRQRLDELKDACRRYVHGQLAEQLRQRLTAKLPTGERWELVGAEDDPDGQTLLFHYPTCWGHDSSRYVTPAVRLEFGARSDPWPASEERIVPMVAEEFPQLFSAAACPVRALAAERTFWEKAMLLHEENFRPLEKGHKRRMARHYYDLWALITRGVAQSAVADATLFDAVAAHRRIFFNWSWMDYATIRKGSLRIVPLPDRMSAWRRDYDEMRREMFFDEPPTFVEVIATVQEFEERFNRKSFS